MGSKRVTVDQRLANLLSYLCEKEGINQETLENKKGEISFGSIYVHDIKALKETIDYLKDYAKIQIIAQGLSNQKEELESNINDAQADFQRIIDEIKAKKKSLPRVTKKKIKAEMLGFQAEMEEEEQSRYEKALEERKAKVKSMEQDIKLYENKIKKLESIRKSIGKPNKMMQQLLPDDYMKVKENYARLVNLCVASMTDGYSKKDLIGDDKVFKLQRGSYTVNYNNARSFLSAIKSRKELMELKKYIEAKKDFQELADEYERTSDEKRKTEEALKVIDSKEFNYISDKMNNLIEEYNKVDSIEYKAYRGNIFTRLANKVKKLLGLPVRRKIPKKVWEARSQLSEVIKDFTEEIKGDEQKTKAFEAYQIASKKAGRKCFASIQELEWNATTIKQYGTDKVSLPEKTISVYALKMYLATSNQKLQEDVRNIKEKRTQAKENALGLYTKLSKESKKLLETQGEKNILDFIKTYYPDEKTNKRLFSRQIEPSTAAIILESILGRKNISWESIADSYAQILGKQKLTEERASLDQIINDKVENLRTTLEPKQKENEEVR